jgi:hypothetical protein
MVFEKPVIDKSELARALDPLHNGRDANFRSARFSPGVLAGWAPTEAGARGDLKLFCSLNRDAVVAIRHARFDLAEELLDHANRIERETLAPWLTAANPRFLRCIREDRQIDSRPDVDSWAEHLFFAPRGSDQIEVASIVWEAAQDVAQVRSQLGLGEDPATRVSLGRITSIGREYTDLEPEEETISDLPALFTEEVLAKGLQLGDPVVVRREKLAPGIILTTFERALEHETKVSPLTGRRVPSRLDQLLDDGAQSPRTHAVRPLRRVA